MIRLLLLLVGLIAAAGAPASAREVNNIWMMWERSALTDPACEAGQSCDTVSDFRSHFMLNMPAGDAQALFQSLQPAARALGSADVAHDRLPICWEEPATLNAVPKVGSVEYATAVETLRGLEAVHIDLANVIGPPWYRGEFGPAAQTQMLEIFGRAGITILSKEEVAETQGRPTLTMRYSHDVAGCRPWSVSLTLKQDVALTRAPNLVIHATTWSTSRRENQDDPEFDPDDAVEGVLVAFAQAYTEANRVGHDEANAAQ